MDTDFPEISNFVLERKLGQGGMATVYLAKQVLLNRRVALKIMAPEYSNASFRDAFLHEGRVVARLEHPNIVKIYDIGITDGSIFFMAMEYLAGGNLRDKLNRQRLTVEGVQQILAQVGQGLEYAHKQHFIHRDIKPENILFRQDGVAILTDFGIAKLQDTTGEMTRMGYTAGTAHYMSPEQASSGQLDYRSDIYSLALVAFEMLSGEKVCKADSLIQAIHQHTAVPTPLLPDEYHLFQPVFNKALAKKPGDRYPSVNDFIAGFNNIAHDFRSHQQWEVSTDDDDRTVMFDVDEVVATRQPPLVSTVSHSEKEEAETSQIYITPENEPTPFWKSPFFIMGAVGALIVGLVLTFLLSSGDSSSPVTSTVSEYQPPPPPVNTDPVFTPGSGLGSNTANDPRKPNPIPPALSPEEVGQVMVVKTQQNDPLSLREGAGKNYSIIARLPVGTQVNVTQNSETKGWVKVKVAEKTGFVFAKYLRPFSQADSLQGKHYVVRKSGARLYSGHSVTSRLMVSFPSGTSLVAIGTSLHADRVNGAKGSWFQVRAQGYSGYVFDRDVFPLNQKLESTNKCNTLSRKGFVGRQAA